jgi:hypothetical protein
MKSRAHVARRGVLGAGGVLAVLTLIPRACAGRRLAVSAADPVAKGRVEAQSGAELRTEANARAVAGPSRSRLASPHGYRSLASPPQVKRCATVGLTWTFDAP